MEELAHVLIVITCFVAAYAFVKVGYRIGRHAGYTEALRDWEAACEADFQNSPEAKGE